MRVSFPDRKTCRNGFTITPSQLSNFSSSCTTTLPTLCQPSCLPKSWAPWPAHYSQHATIAVKTAAAQVRLQTRYHASFTRRIMKMNLNLNLNFSIVCCRWQEPVLVRSPSKDVGLTSHAVRKLVMDFLRVIIVDSLSLPVTAKSSPVIDLVLEAWPEHTSTGQQTEYQSQVLAILMEHLLAADVLIGEQAGLPVVPGGSANNITNNVCYVTARIVDKLWQGNCCGKSCFDC